MNKLVDADSVRPAGKPGECFYCHRPVGSEHEYKCVCNSHKVKVRYIITMERDYPVSWDKNMIEFHMNESSWCSSNIIQELEEHEKDHGCICDIVVGEVVEEGN